MYGKQKLVGAARLASLGAKGCACLETVELDETKSDDSGEAVACTAKPKLPLKSAGVRIPTLRYSEDGGEPVFRRSGASGLAEEWRPWQRTTDGSYRPAKVLVDSGGAPYSEPAAVQPPAAGDRESRAGRVVAV